MIELNSKIKEALIEIDFIKRYEEVSNKFKFAKYMDGKCLSS